MSANEQPAGAGPKVAVSLDELRAGAGQLHDLAEEATAKLASSDQALETSSSAWHGLSSAAAYAAYAEFETARGKAATGSLATASENVGHAVNHYEHTDNTNADSLGLTSR
ncbi:MAG: WXG100 family type VII secretion target [Segniliparus sp.]|uniref:WXG100 family type VII secretion target n=1 Tax=Segniliparus sp. TaxID=2804064 RepID=UPI003F2E1D7D